MIERLVMFILGGMFGAMIALVTIALLAAGSDDNDPLIRARRKGRP